MSVNLVNYLVEEAGLASLTIMKSSTIYLGLEVISRVAEGGLHRCTGVLLRPGRAGLMRFVFKLIRPFSGVDPNNTYKFPTAPLILYTIAVGTLTHLTSQFITPRSISCICPAN